MKQNNQKLVVGIGSALVDILVHEDDSFLESAGILKGGMTYVDSEYIDTLAAKVKGNPHIVPGGSACNTIMGIGKLGGSARFVGKLGEDELGNFFQTGLQNNNVESFIFKSASPTGRVLSVITPDAQRSMLTYLGAASEAQANEITDQCFNNAAVVHIEGYLVYNEELFLSVLSAAKKSGARLSLDLASFTVVEEKKSLLKNIVDNFVDILIANEDEARVFTGYDDEADAIRALSENAEIAVLKVGERGSLISHKGILIKIEPKGTGTAIDTTGAGDLWASGFLYGLINDYPLEKCGEIGSMCGYEVCQVVGASIPEQGWERIREALLK